MCTGQQSDFVEEKYAVEMGLVGPAGSALGGCRLTSSLYAMKAEVSSVSAEGAGLWLKDLTRTDGN